MSETQAAVERMVEILPQYALDPIRSEVVAMLLHLLAERDVALARAEEAVQRAGEAARDALQEAEEHHGTRNQRDRALARVKALEEGLRDAAGALEYASEHFSEGPWEAKTRRSIAKAHAILAPVQEAPK